MEKTFSLRACVVNFRTRLADIEALPGIVVREGKAADARMRPPTWGKRSESDPVHRLSI
jgi:hypothetical protein